MFIAQRPEKPPARFRGAELNLTDIRLVSFRPSEPRLVIRGRRSINIPLLRSINFVNAAFKNHKHATQSKKVCQPWLLLEQRKVIIAPEAQSGLW
jgi:hypothetical protein